MNALIDFIISACTALASLMPAFGKIKDNRYKGLNKIRPLGWLTILSLIASIGLTFYKTYLNEKDNNKKGVYNKIEQSRRDKYTKNNYDSSLVEIKKQFDTSNISVVKVLTETLGKYGYKFDSANTQLTKIVRDSSKTKVFVADDPILTLCYSDGISFDNLGNGQYNIGTKICSMDASSTGFNISIQSVIMDSTGQLHYLGSNDNVLNYDDVMPKDSNKGRIQTYDIKYSMTAYFVVIRGSYFNGSKSKKYPINSGGMYVVKEKANKSITSKGRKWIYEFLDSNPKTE